MTDLRKAAEMALEDICGAKVCEVNSMSSRAEMLRLMDKAAEALRQALAQPEHEPVAWVIEDGEVDYYVDVVAKIKPGTPLYTAPPKKEWVGLTVNEARKFYEKYTDREELIYAIDKFLEEKNT